LRLIITETINRQNKKENEDVIYTQKKNKRFEEEV
jgi:hypothetical protein